MTRVSACVLFSFFLHDTSPTEIYTLSLHDALPICPGEGSGPPSGTSHPWSTRCRRTRRGWRSAAGPRSPLRSRSEEHTSELQSHVNLVCRLLLEKKKTKHVYRSVEQEKKSVLTPYG